MRRSRQYFRALNFCVSVALSLLPGTIPLSAGGTVDPLVTLTIREIHGIARANVVVSSGLPFAKGRLREHSALAAQTSLGKTIPSQFDVLASWDDGSVKWVLVTVVVAELKAGGRFQFALVERRSPGEVGGAKIQRFDRGVQVEYPKLSVKTNLLGLPESVSLKQGDGQIEYVRGDSHLLLLGESVRPEEAQLDDVQIEERGPIQTVVRTQGTITMKKGVSFNYISRNTIFAGGRISTSYTVINHQIDGFHGYGVRLPLADGFQNGRLARQDVALENAPVGVRQTAPERAVFYGGPFGGESVAARHHGGVRLSGESKSLGVSIHDFWQRYPSELSVTGDHAELLFYPLAEKEPSPLYRVGRVARGEFTMVVDVAASPNWSARQLGRSDLHAFASPRWYLDSGVLGKYALGDSDLPQGTYHGHIDQHMSWLKRRKFLVNEFGFWDFGDGRDAADSAFRRNNEFGISYAMLFHYLRTGDVRFFEEGVAFAKHFRDIDTLHFGEMKGKSIRHTDNHVDGGSGYNVAHQWVEGMLLQYLLTGDRRSLEVAREMGYHLIEYAHDMSPRLKAKPRTIPATERDLGWALLSLMFLEETTGEAQYTEAIETLIEGVVASQDQERGHWPRSLPHPDFDTGGATFMLGVLTEALMRYHEKTGDPDVARSILKTSYWLSDEMWNPDVKNLRYKQWDEFWDHYNDGRTIPMVLPGMVYAEHLSRSDERYRRIMDDTLKVDARSCANLDKHGEGRNFKSMGMMSRSMPRFFYYYRKARVGRQ